MTKGELLRRLEGFSDDIEIFVTTAESPHYYELTDAQWEHLPNVKRMIGDRPITEGNPAIIMLTGA